MSQLGSAIKEKRKRKGWSQTVLGDQVGMSAATIHRIEHGEKIPTDDELHLIAEVLVLDSNQLLHYATVDHQQLRDTLVPMTSYQIRWEYAHPADYAGRVWIQIYPQPKSSDTHLTIQIQWGAWHYQATHLLASPKPITLWHYKFNDGQGLPLIVDVSQPCYLVFGKDAPPDKPVIDIIDQWHRIQPMSVSQTIRFSINFVMVFIRWHLQHLRWKR